MPRPAPLTSVVLSPDSFFLRIRKENGEEEHSGPLGEVIAALEPYSHGRYAVVLDFKSFCRVIRFPFSQRGRVLEALSFQLEGKLPEDLSAYELHLELIPQKETSLAYTFLFPRRFLKEARETFQNPALLTPPRWLTVAPWVIAPFLPGEDGHHLLLFSDGIQLLSFSSHRLLGVHFFPYTPEELADPLALSSLSIRLLASLKSFPSYPLRIWGAPEQQDIVKNLAHHLQPFLEGVGTGEGDFLAEKERSRLLALLNLELLARGSRPSLNLAPVVFLALPHQLKKQIKLLAPLTFASLLALLTSFHTATHEIRMRAHARENALRAIFLRNLPGEKPVYPLRQLKEYHERILTGTAGNVEGRRIDRILSFHQAIPGEVHLILDELSYLRGEWSLKGKVNDYQEVDLLKEKLSALPWVEELMVERAEQRQDLGKVEIRFRLKERLG